MMHSEPFPSVISEAWQETDAALAVDKLRVAIEAAREINRPNLTAALHNRLGNTLTQLGEIQDAVRVFFDGYMSVLEPFPEEAEAFWKARSRDPKSHRSSRRRLTTLDLFQATLPDDPANAENSPALPVILLLNLGNSYLRQPQFRHARTTWLEAMARPEATAQPVLRAHLLTHLALVDRYNRDWEAARVNLDNAFALLEQHAPQVEHRRAIAARASLFRLQGVWDSAETDYTTAIALYRNAEDRPGEARITAGLAHALLEQNRIVEAQIQYEHAIALAEPLPDEATLWHAFWGLGNCLAAKNEPDAAIDMIERSLALIQKRRLELETDEGKVTFLNSVQDVFDLLLAVQLERAAADPTAWPDALEAARRSRGQALQDLRMIERKSFSSADSDVGDPFISPPPDSNASSETTAEIESLLATPEWSQILEQLHNYGDLFEIAMAA